MRLKSIEQFGKRLATSAIARLMRNDARGTRPDWRERRYKVLFLRHDRIGDMILSTGILHAIARSHPTIELSVLASPINAPVLRNAPYVTEVVVFDRHKPWTYPSALWRLRRARYDAVIDCMITAPSLTTLLLMLATGAPHRIGVRQGNDFAYTLAVPPRESATHMVDKLGALVTAFGIEPSTVKLAPDIVLTTAERDAGEHAWRGETEHAGTRRLRVLVNVSAGRVFRFWPDDRFVHVVETLRRAHTGADVMFIGSPSDRERIESLARRTNARFAATPGIRDAFAIVATSDVVFTPDTSIGHAATAFGKPATVLYVRGMSRLWGPYESPGRTLESVTDDLDPITAEEAGASMLRLVEVAASPTRG